MSTRKKFTLLLATVVAGTVALSLAAQPGPPVTAEETTPDPRVTVLCERVLRCDQTAQYNQEFREDCPAFFQRAGDAFPKFAPGLETCARETPCESLRMTRCIPDFVRVLHGQKVPQQEIAAVVTGKVGEYVDKDGQYDEELQWFSSASLAEMTGICEEIVRCDLQTHGFPDPVEVCTGFLRGANEKYPERVDALYRCLKDQSCEEKNFAACLSKITGMINMSDSE